MKAFLLKYPFVLGCILGAAQIALHHFGSAGDSLGGLIGLVCFVWLIRENHQSKQLNQSYQPFRLVHTGAIMQMFMGALLVVVLHHGFIADNPPPMH